MVAQQHQGQCEQHHPEGHPDQLLLGEGVRVASVGLVGQVEPVDEGQAEPVEGGDDGQQDRIGVRRHDPDDQMGSDDQDGEHPAVAQDVGGHLSLDPDADGGVRPDPHHQREHEQDQLGSAPLSVHEAQQA